MIVFDLHCANGHRFEGWFGSSGDFAEQQAKGFVTCPECGAGEVSKAPMAPAVPIKGNQAATPAISNGADGASPVSNTPITPEMKQAMEALMPVSPAEAWSQMVSPYHYGPFYQNPLRSVVDAFDFEQVCCGEGPALFVGATCVRSGKIRVFEGAQISTDAILASACLPTLFQAVEIYDPKTGRDEAYWDGGYTGNPALFPLFTNALPEDIVIVNINPLERDEVPKSPQQIQNRVNEISFNSSLLRELRAIDFVQRLLEDGTLEPGRMNRVLVHMIADDEMMRELSVTTKMIPLPQVLNQLKQAGRAAADRFLAAHFDDLGKSSSVDLRGMFS